MPNVFFTADTHFHHARIIEYSHRPFRNVDEMNEILVDNWNARVQPQDVVYHLGDFSFSRKLDEIERIAARLNGSIHLIFGNHDRSAVRKARAFAWKGDYKKIKVAGQKIILLHYAMTVWDASHHGSWQLFGHSHGSLPVDSTKRQCDVGVDVWNYAPVSFDEVAQVMATRTFVPVDHHMGR